MTSSIHDLRVWYVPLVITLVTISLWPVPAELLDLWLDSDRPYSHGLLLAPLAAYLLVSRAIERGSTPVQPSWTAYALFVGLLLVWLLGRAADVLVLTQVTFPVLLLLAVSTVFGWAAGGAVAFPLGLMFYAIPVWNYFVPALQSLTVMAVRLALDGYGIPIHVEGNFISIPEGTFEVAGGCAGLHYFIVALIIASLYTHTSGRGGRTGALLLGIAALIAMLTNWIRVGVLVWIGHQTNMQHYLVAEDHYYFGWVLFALALVPFFGCAGWITARSPARQAEQPAVLVREAAASGWLVTLLVATVLVPLVLYAIPARPSRDSALVTLPSGTAEWTGPQEGDAGWPPQLVGTHGEALGRYYRSDQWVDVYIGVYLSQDQGRELVGDQPFGAGGVASPTLRSIDGLRGGGVRELILGDARTEAQRLVWYWYLVGSTSTASSLEAKLIQALRALARDESAAMVAVSVRCSQECGDADRAALARYLVDMGASLEAVGVAAQAAS